MKTTVNYYTDDKNNILSFNIWHRELTPGEKKVLQMTTPTLYYISNNQSVFHLHEYDGKLTTDEILTKLKTELTEDTYNALEQCINLAKMELV